MGSIWHYSSCSTSVPIFLYLQIKQKCFHCASFEWHFLKIHNSLLFTVSYWRDCILQNLFSIHTYTIRIAVKVLEFKKMFSRVDLFFVFLNDMKLWCVKNQLPRRFDGRNLSIISVKTLANGYIQYRNIPTDL